MPLPAVCGTPSVQMMQPVVLSGGPWCMSLSYNAASKPVAPPTLPMSIAVLCVQVPPAPRSATVNPPQRKPLDPELQKVSSSNATAPRRLVAPL